MGPSHMEHADQVRRYGGRLLTIEGHTVVEMIDPNDGSRARHQYRRRGEAIEHRIVARGGAAGPWELRSPGEVALMRAQRGAYHPILDPLGL